MKWILYITIISFIGFVFSLVKARKDAQKEPENGTTIVYPDEEMFQENDIDEFSPDSMISDQTIKDVSLKYKLKKIEEEETKIDSFDFDNREDGK
jgi:hypothetical protein